MVNKKIKIIASFWLVISLVFLIPLNMGVVFADGIASNQEVRSSVCGATNVKSSLILSIVTLCLPGILEKVYQYKQIKCEAAQCYYNAVKSGLDPSFCVKHQAYKTCTYIVGEAFAIPPMSMLEYWRNAISNALANPVGILWGYGVKEARLYLKANPGPSYISGFATIFVGITDIVGLIGQVKQMMENGFFPPINQKDACENMKDIKSEMQEIVNAK